MGIRERLARLEKLLEGEVIEIPLRDGTVVRFPQSAGRGAFLNIMARMGAGPDAPPEHPMLEAVRNSDDPKWTASFYAVDHLEAWTAPVEDLSE